MIYDIGLIEHMIELKAAQGESIPRSYLLFRAILGSRSVRFFFACAEALLHFLLTLPIPFYSKLVLMTVTYFPGTPGFLGNYIRGVYYSKKLGSIGKNTIIDQGVIIRYPSRVHLAEFVLLDKNVILDAGHINIGKRVHIAENCVISGSGEFTMEDYSCLAQSSSVVTATDTPADGYRGSGPMLPPNQRKVVLGDVVFGKDAFVGIGARILPGVTLGEGSVVGAGAVVTKSVEPWKIVVGIPAKVIGEREKVKFPDP